MGPSCAIRVATRLIAGQHRAVEPLRGAPNGWKTIRTSGQPLRCGTARNPPSDPSAGPLRAPALRSGAMPDLSSLFPLILVTHISLAVALFVPSLLLPFTLRSRSVQPGHEASRPGRLTRLMLWMQAHGTVIIGVGLALTGIAMVAVLGTRILEQPWLLVSLATYAVAALIAFAFQRPSLRRLLRRDDVRSDVDRAAWREGAKRQRYVAYALTTAVGLIAFLMSTKPVLW